MDDQRRDPAGGKGPRRAFERQREFETCFRCGDVTIYCDCIRDLQERITKLEAQGTDWTQLHPDEVQPPTALELEHRRRKAAEEEELRRPPETRGDGK